MRQSAIECAWNKNLTIAGRQCGGRVNDMSMKI